MIAYLILVHRYPKQFKQLFRAIYRPENFYAIHVDKRSDANIHAEIKLFVKSFANATVLKSQNALWGGYSLVEVELRGIKALRQMGEWKFFINLSGQDFPLKTQTYINNFLNEHHGQDFLKVVDQRQMRPGTMARVENFCLELGHRIVRTTIRRKFLAKPKPYIGNQWMILSRRFCDFLIESPEVTRFENFYRHTFIADEGFFQTVIMNTTYESRLVKDDMRAIDWVPEGLIKLRPRTFGIDDAPFLLSSTDLFARKFDETVDQPIIDLLDKKLQTV